MINAIDYFDMSFSPQDCIKSASWQAYTSLHVVASTAALADEIRASGGRTDGQLMLSCTSVHL